MLILRVHMGFQSQLYSSHHYIDHFASVIPIDNETVRTVLDTDDGVCQIRNYL